MDAQSSLQWYIREVYLYDVSCDAAASKDPLQPLSARGSGHADPSHSAEEAIDGDMSTEWQGTPDADYGLWIEMTFNESRPVGCAKLIQCNCLDSVRAVVLEYEPTNYVWEVAAFQDNMLWGEATLAS